MSPGVSAIAIVSARTLTVAFIAGPIATTVAYAVAIVAIAIVAIVTSAAAAV